MPGYHLPYFTAEAKGIYASYGLEVDIVDPEPGADNVRAVAARRYDACLTSAAYFLRAKTEDRRLPARFVFMVARRTHMAAFLATDPGSRGPGFGDLAGTSYLGEPGSPFTREYMSLVRHLGMTPPSVIETPYETITFALAKGGGRVAADFLDLWPKFKRAADACGSAIVPLPFYEAGIQAYGSGLVVGDRFISERPEVVDALARAIADGLEATRRDPRLGLRALCDRFPETDPELAISGWEAGAPLIFGSGRTGTMDEAGWRETVEHYASTHGTARLSPVELFVGSFTKARS